MDFIRQQRHLSLEIAILLAVILISFENKRETSNAGKGFALLLLKIMQGNESKSGESTSTVSSVVFLLISPHKKRGSYEFLWPRCTELWLICVIVHGLAIECWECGGETVVLSLEVFHGLGVTLESWKCGGKVVF